MAGCNLYVVSGIDGLFNEFDSYLKSYLTYQSIYYLKYDHAISFAENLKQMTEDIKDSNSIILGWSIGAVISLFLAEEFDFKHCICINSFFNRRVILEKRGIQCDEDVFVETISCKNRNFTIITGGCDDKIPSSQSMEIKEHLEKDNFVKFVTFPNAKHNLKSFPQEEIFKIVNKLSESLKNELNDYYSKKQQ